MTDKNSKEKIKQLKKYKKYDEIFIEYGQEVYIKNVPSSYKKQDLKQLKQERRYEEIYNKYGENEYNKSLIRAMYEEIKEVKGTGKAMLWRASRKIFKLTEVFGITASLAFPAFTVKFADVSEEKMQENAMKYESEIKEYNEKNFDYATEVQSMKLSNIQTFMKVMDDMWKNIKGYATPEKDISGYWELDLSTEEGYGVCRNMASDVAKKLNEINPEWNARIINVQMGETKNFKMANIERNLLETNETVITEEEESAKEQNNASNLMQGISGDHIVLLVDIHEDNITLVLDPTNPAIGVYINGRIIIFNSTDGKDIHYDVKEWATATVFKGGKDGIVSTIEDYAQSFRKPQITIEEMKAKYGLDAQNKALEEVRTYSIANENKEKSFRDRIKVNLDEETVQIVQEDFTYSKEKDKIIKDNEGR